jgi:UDP-N-acetyl-D-glucosamine/UDP-N-acetyl-D-galactosamine dehydrogenase
MNMKKHKIGILGLGYVGLPLAVEFSSKYNVVGYDIDNKRINELNASIDKTFEVDSQLLKNALNSSLEITSKTTMLKDCNIYIITVPTPIDSKKNPDLSYLKNASKLVGSLIDNNDIVIYESTVYPGCTEEDCVPILEKHSGLTYNKEFYCGYSPERINPGDKVNTLTNIKKVTSGSNTKTADIVDNLYSSIIKAGTFRATSIKVAEASKAIENAQRDLNISFMNELAIIFDKMGLDTNDVLEAARTKWNFLNFKPGIVGGHCIGVDPYYLLYKSKKLGYLPKVILSGREINDKMGMFIGQKVESLMQEKQINLSKSKTLILGITFKENCPDIRNSKVKDIYNYLKNKNSQVYVHDPFANAEEVKKEFNIKLISNFEKYDIIILAVAHSDYKDLNIVELKKDKDSIIYDVKGVLDRKIVDERL